MLGGSNTSPLSESIWALPGPVWVGGGDEELEGGGRQPVNAPSILEALSVYGRATPGRGSGSGLMSGPGPGAGYYRTREAGRGRGGRAVRGPLHGGTERQRARAAVHVDRAGPARAQAA